MAVVDVTIHLAAAALLGEPPWRWWAAVLVVLQAATLPWRRTAPVPVLVLVAPQWWSVSGLSHLIALYSVARHTPLRLSVPVVALAATTTALTLHPVGGAVEVVAGTAVVHLPPLLLDVVRSERLLALERRRERERQWAGERSLRAVASERARIAQELHGLVTASLEGMAGVARSAHQRFDDDPAAARDALAEVQAGGRGTMIAMRRLLGILRSPDGSGSALAPQPTLAQVTDLVAVARAHGLDVRLRVQGEPRALPDEVGLAAYRVLQESLSRAWQQGWSTGVQVVLAYADRGLRVAVVVGADRRYTRADVAVVREWARLAGGELHIEEDARHRSLEVRFALPERGAAA